MGSIIPVPPKRSAERTYAEVKAEIDQLFY